MQHIAQQISWRAGRIVLYAYDKMPPRVEIKQSANIQMLDSENLVLWTVNGMEHSYDRSSMHRPDTFVWLNQNGELLYANTFDGHVFQINPENGLATYSGFAK